MTNLVESMSNVRFAISVRRTIMQDKKPFSFRIVPLPTEKLIKPAFLKNFQHRKQNIPTSILTATEIHRLTLLQNISIIESTAAYQRHYCYYYYYSTTMQLARTLPLEGLLLFQQHYPSLTEENLFVVN